jgi:hypothetical protein
MRSESRVFNISIKVTANQKFEFERIAKSHGLSTSEWGALILSRYKNSYGEESHTKKIYYFLNLMIEDLDKEEEKLKTQMKESYVSSTQMDFYQIKLMHNNIRKAELIKFKKRVEEHLF